jgi:hypothetical protein
MTKPKVLLIIGLSGFLFFLNSCQSKSTIDLTNVYPYIIPEDYLLEGLKEETVIADTLDDGVYVTLVYDLNGMVQNVKKSDLEQADVSVKTAYDTSLTHLESAMKRQEIAISRFFGPDSVPFLLFSDHWLSAACLVNPKLYSFAKDYLKTDVINASIPHRDAMILFPDCREEQMQKFKEMIKEKESDGLKPLTLDLFKLTKDKVVPAD